MPGGIVNSVSPHIMSAGTIIPPAAFLEIVPGPKGALALGIGASGLPPGSMTLVIDAAPLPAFVLAAVDPAGTWTRMDTGAVLA